MNQSWNSLLDFETRDLVKEYYFKRHGRDLNSEKTNEINCNFIQGRAYFESARRADFTVSPLLLYYGVLSLSKGLILTMSLSIRETSLKSSHGLSINNWPEIINSRGFGKLKIKIENGSLGELLNITENKNYLRSNSNGVNLCSSFNSPEEDDIFSLEQLIPCFPDLKNEFNSWTGKELVFAIYQSINLVGDNRYEFTINKALSVDLINKLFPEEYCNNRTVNGKTISFETDDWAPNMTQQYGNVLGIGSVCIIPGLDNDKGFNMLCGMFVISYVFGMLARYYPSTWISLRRGNKGDRIYPFASRIQEFIHEKYPLAILDFLKSPYSFE